MQWVSMEDDLLNLKEWKPFRVVAKTMKVCIIDPYPKNVNDLWDIWVCGSKPFLELQWDPMDGVREMLMIRWFLSLTTL